MLHPTPLSLLLLDKSRLLSEIEYCKLPDIQFPLSLIRFECRFSPSYCQIHGKLEHEHFLLIGLQQSKQSLVSLKKVQLSVVLTWVILPSLVLYSMQQLHQLLVDQIHSTIDHPFESMLCFYPHLLKTHREH
jgi:hypothetical protein